MYKLVWPLLLLTLLVASCTVSRKGKSVIIKGSNGDSLLVKDIREQNIATGGFFIKKANIEILEGGDNEKLTATIRKTTDNEYLISIRSKTGIEAARIFLNEDTVLINDRINNQLLYGKPEAMERRYGFNFWQLPLIFGDFLSDEVYSVLVGCNDGIAGKDTEWRNTKLAYEVDCRQTKAVSVRVGRKSERASIIINYSDFVEAGSIKYPQKVRIEDSASGYVLMIEYDSVEIPWNGELEFIPGSRFEKVELK